MVMHKTDVSSATIDNHKILCQLHCMVGAGSSLVCCGCGHTTTRVFIEEGSPAFSWSARFAASDFVSDE